MTVSSSISREQYATDGVTTVFTIHFAFFEDTNVNAAFVDSAGNSTTLTLNTDFTAVPTFDSDSNPTGGSATLMVAPAAAGTLTLFRIIPLTQESKYVENDTFPAARAMGDLDLAAMRDQQLDDASSRSLSFPVTVDPDVSAELPVPVADTFLGFSSDGLSIEAKALPSGTVVFTSVNNQRAGTSGTEAATPDSVASLWQEGIPLVSAASIAKPGSGNLGGYYTQSGNTQVDNYWADVKGGIEMEIRYTGTPLLSIAGNILPPGAAAFQVIAGDIIRWRWDAALSKWRVNGGMRADGSALVKVEIIAIPISSSPTAVVATGTSKRVFRMPFGATFTVTGVRASLATAQASGSILTVDINDSGTSILSTKLTIDNTEKTSTTAATPAVISDTSIADDAEVSIDVDQVGDGTGCGLVVYLMGHY